MMVSLFNKKLYKGGFESQEQAARYFDHVSIHVYGLDAKTNYAYTAGAVSEILDRHSGKDLFCPRLIDDEC